MTPGHLALHGFWAWFFSCLTFMVLSAAYNKIFDLAWPQPMKVSTGK